MISRISFDRKIVRIVRHAAAIVIFFSKKFIYSFLFDDYQMIRICI